MEDEPRRLSWLGSTKGKFVEKLSFTKLGEELGIAMGMLERHKIIERLEELFNKIRNKTKKYSIAICNENGQIAIAEKNQDGRVIWKTATRVHESPKEQKILVNQEDHEMRQIAKEISSAALVRRQDGNPNQWWLSLSSIKERIECLMDWRGMKEMHRHCFPSLYKINDKGVMSNLRRREQLEISTRIEEERRYLQNQLGVPEYDDSPLTKKTIITHISMTEDGVKKDLAKLRKYVLNEKTMNERNEEIFQRAVRRIVKKGIPDIKTLELIQHASSEYNNNKRADYRIGGYLANAGIFVEYTRLRGRSKEVGCYPLKFEKKNGKICKLVPVRDAEINKITKILCGIDINRIQPRIICVLKDKNGKKVVNGQFYDVMNIRKESLKEPNDIILRTIKPSILCEQKMDVRAMGVYDTSKKLRSPQNRKTENVNVENDESIRVSDHFPAIVMIENDRNKEIRDHYKEIMEQNCVAVNDGTNINGSELNDNHKGQHENRNENNENTNVLEDTQEHQKIHQISNSNLNSSMIDRNSCNDEKNQILKSSESEGSERANTKILEISRNSEEFNNSVHTHDIEYISIDNNNKNNVDIERHITEKSRSGLKEAENTEALQQAEKTCISNKSYSVECIHKQGLIMAENNNNNNPEQKLCVLEINENSNFINIKVMIDENLIKSRTINVTIKAHGKKTQQCWNDGKVLKNDWAQKEREDAFVKENQDQNWDAHKNRIEMESDKINEKTKKKHDNKKTLNIYGDSINNNYDDWILITKKKERFPQPFYVERKIGTKLKDKFVTLLKRVPMQQKCYAWLNLPHYIGSKNT